MNKNEKELFLHLCTFYHPNATKIAKRLERGGATPAVLGMLFANRMAAAAYGVLDQTELLDRTDREFRNSLRHAAALNESMNREYTRCVVFLSEILEEAKLPYALLKGAYLCHRYPKGYRTSNDIDVLVASESVSEISDRLCQFGFKQGYIQNGVFVPATRAQIIRSKMTRGETVPFVKEVGLPFMKYLEVDLNFSLDYKNSNGDVPGAMLERTRLVAVKGGALRTLDVYDFLLHLCAHLYKEATTMPWIRMKRDMTFYKYADIYMMLSDFCPSDWLILWERANLYGMKKELAYGVRSVDALLGMAFADALPLLDEGDVLHEVIAPGEKKRYRYTQTDLVKRFFSPDRTRWLREVRE